MIEGNEAKWPNFCPCKLKQVTATSEKLLPFERDMEEKKNTGKSMTDSNWSQIVSVSRDIRRWYVQLIFIGEVESSNTGKPLVSKTVLLVLRDF